MKTFYIWTLLIVHGVYALPNCPVCGSDTLLVSEQEDDTSKPSRNVSVWNRSMCGNSTFKGESSICPKDHYAYDASMMKWWELSLEDKDGFTLPLDKSVYKFPLTKKTLYRVVYSQDFITKDRVRHALNFWCMTDHTYFKNIREYAEKNNLNLDISIGDDRSYVIVETMSMRELNAPRLKRLQDLELQKIKMAEQAD